MTLVVMYKCHPYTVNQLNFAAVKFRGFGRFWAIIGDFPYIFPFNWYATEIREIKAVAKFSWFTVCSYLWHTFTTLGAYLPIPILFRGYNRNKLQHFVKYVKNMVSSRFFLSLPTTWWRPILHGFASRFKSTLSMKTPERWCPSRVMSSLSVFLTKSPSSSHFPCMQEI